MIDGRFSAEAFAERGLDTEPARELADELAHEMQMELHHLVDSYARSVVERLNAMGHNLKLRDSTPGDDTYPGDISCREDWEDNAGYHCKLRLGINTVVTAGYAHFMTEDEALSVKSLDERIGEN